MRISNVMMMMMMTMINHHEQLASVTVHERHNDVHHHKWDLCLFLG